MGFLQQVKLRFSGKFVKQSNANNFKNKSLNVHVISRVSVSNRAKVK